MEKSTKVQGRPPEEEARSPAIDPSLLRSVMGFFLILASSSFFASFAFADGVRSISYTKEFETDNLVDAQNWNRQYEYEEKVPGNEQIDWERQFPGYLYNLERDAYVNVWLAAIFSVSAFEPQIKPLFDDCVRREQDQFISDLEEPPTLLDRAKKQLTKTERDKLVWKAIWKTLIISYSTPQIFCGVAPFQFLVALDLVDPFESPGLGEIPSISKDWRIDPSKRSQIATSLKGLYDRVLAATRNLTPEAIELLKLSMQVRATDRAAFLVNLSNKLKNQDLETLSAWAASLNSNLTGEDPRKIQDVMKADPNIRGLFSVFNSLAARHIDAYTQFGVSHPLLKEEGFTLFEWQKALEFSHYYQIKQWLSNDSAQFKDLNPIYKLGTPLKVLENYECKVKKSTLIMRGTDLPFGYLDCRK